MEVIISFLIPISSIALLFLKDENKGRGRLMAALLIANALFFLFPMILAYASTPAHESMLNKNTGGGAALWLYIFVFPLSAFIQLVLLILKVVFAKRAA